MVAGRLGVERAVRRVARAVPAAAVNVPMPKARAALITPERAAWSIAGTRYRAATTLYVFPDGTAVRGDQIREWDDLPRNTEVHLGVPKAGSGVVSAERTAWSIAAGDNDAVTTRYTLPDGTARRRDEITDWSNLPEGTQVHLDVLDQPES